MGNQPIVDLPFDLYGIQAGNIFCIQAQGHFFLRGDPILSYGHTIRSTLDRNYFTSSCIVEYGAKADAILFIAK